MKSAFFIDWMGNKFSQRQILRMVLPAEFDEFVEAFGGSAGFSRTLVNEGAIDSGNVWINDRYVPLASFWKIVSDNVNDLIVRIIDIQEYHGFGTRELYETHLKKLDLDLSDLDMAETFYIVNQLCGGSFMLGDMYFKHPMKRADYGLRSEGISNLREVGMLMKGCKVTGGDYQAIVPRSSSSLVFADPPYRLGKKKEIRFYGAPFDHQRFAAWCHRVRDRNPMLITYDDNAAHLANFKGWNIYRHHVFFGGRHIWGKELIITNYEIPYWEMIDGELELAA